MDVSVTSLGYLHLQATSLDEWRTFAGDFLGFVEVPGTDPDALYYRMDELPHRLVVREGPEPAATAIGFQVHDRRTLDELVARVEKSGIEVAESSETERAERRVTDFVRFADPGGNRLELFYGPTIGRESLRTPAVDFVTGSLGMGHVIVTAEDARASYDFYTETLGFRERNTMRVPDGTLWFLGCNPRQHTLGILPMAGPGRLVHLMVEVATIDDLGLALDRVDEHGVPVQQTLGRHTNDHMVSFYVYSPERYAIEVGWNGRLVHEEEPVFEIADRAFWGHKLFPPPEA